jgi:hypothetical protein
MSYNEETFDALVKRVCAEENVQLDYVVRTFIQVISDMSTKLEENLSTATDTVPRIGLLPVTAVNVAGQTRQVTHASLFPSMRAIMPMYVVTH